jgi:hypothetical protein
MMQATRSRDEDAGNALLLHQHPHPTFPPYIYLSIHLIYRHIYVDILEERGERREERGERREERGERREEREERRERRERAERREPLEREKEIREPLERESDPENH